MSNTREQSLLQFDSLLSRIREIGISKRIAPDSDDFELEQQVLALDEFIHEYEGLQATLEEMELMEEISRLPTAAEIDSIIPKMFQKIVKGEWDGTPDALKRLLVRNYPDLSPRAVKRLQISKRSATRSTKGKGCLLLLSIFPISGLVFTAAYLIVKMA